MSVEKIGKVAAELVASGFTFTEGMASDKDGNFFFVDIGENRIHYYNIDKAEVSIVMEKTGGADGLFVDSENSLWVCEINGRLISKIDAEGKYSVQYDNYQGTQLSGPNDLWFDSFGGFYFTDSYQGHSDRGANTAFYYVDTSGNITLMDKGYFKSNGIHGSPDESRLYVADYLDDKIYCYDILGKGVLGERKLFANVRCDGMTVDEKGNLYLCTGNYGDLVILNSEGENIGSVIVPECPHNLCFAGKEYNELYIAATTGIYRAIPGVKGAVTGSPNKIT